MMNQVAKICLSCKHFRLVEEAVGICRQNKQQAGQYPEKEVGESCEMWRDCGQQYYIRLGWIRNQQSKKEEGTV